MYHKQYLREVESLARIVERADTLAAPSIGESIPEWRRRENERIARDGRIVPVWVTFNGHDPIL